MNQAPVLLGNILKMKRSIVEVFTTIRFVAGRLTRSGSFWGGQIGGVCWCGKISTAAPGLF